MSTEREAGATARVRRDSTGTVSTGTAATGAGATSSATVVVSPVAIERFDEYVLVGKLGHGGMAEVFLALAQGPSGFRKLLVIKRLHGHMRDDPALVEMFLHEAKLAARLNHPNVVQTNKVGSFEGHHFLAMEYLDGQPLNRVLKRTRDEAGALRAPLAARVVSDALDGLHYAHEASDFDGSPLRIVHRDISPHNVFVTYEGQVKLLDFGIAKAATQESNTRTGLIKGKFAYIAPEQARGDVVDRRADIWSMGITLWECLAGRRLFRGSSEVAVLHATLHDPIPRLAEVVSGVPDELSRIVDRALQRDPDRRYPTALAFKEDLDEWLATQSKASSRTTLSASMKAVFSDTIEAQRASLRGCLAQVESATVSFAGLSTIAPLPRDGTPVTISGKVLKAQPAVPPPVESAPRDQRWKLAAIGGAVVIGLLLAVLVPMAMGGAGAPAAAGEPAGGDAPALQPRGGADPAVSAPPPVASPGTRAGTPPVEPALPPAAGPIEVRRAAEPEIAGEDRGEARQGRPARHGPTRRPPPAAEPPAAVAAITPPEPPPPEPPPPVAPQPALGRLSLETTPWAIVFLGTRRLGITPLDEVELPAGSHTLTLRNPERGIETTYRVTVAAGAVTSRRIALE